MSLDVKEKNLLEAYYWLFIIVLGVLISTKIDTFLIKERLDKLSTLTNLVNNVQSPLDKR